MKDSVRILGTRGSVPVSGAAYQRYGGATTCVLVCLDDRYVILDAGTGLASLPPQVLEAPSLDLILTHPHIDHLLGLPLCPYLFRHNSQLSVYARERMGLTAGEQVGRLFAPPLWPITPEQAACKIRFFELPDEMRLGGIRIDTMEGSHPGGVTLVRLTGSAHTVVFATDCTITEELSAPLSAFADACDLLLCDGQYSDGEWPSHSRFGHNTWNAAARFGRQCGAGTMRVIHHDPSHTDDMLWEAERSIQALFPFCSFAKEGETIFL